MKDQRDEYEVVAALQRTQGSIKDSAGRHHLINTRVDSARQEKLEALMHAAGSNPQLRYFSGAAQSCLRLVRRFRLKVFLEV